FAARPGERLYATGDLARYRPDGAIEFAGRIDGQIKIRGFRVELGEIEAALHRHPAVREVAVIDREDIPGQRRLVAYVVPEPEAGAGAGDNLARSLREFLSTRLPAYMVPAAFVRLDALPLAPTGKIDRRALPAPAPEATPAAGEGTPPRTETEALLARIWADVLGLPRVSVHDNFFELGGDSILSIQIVARAAEAGCRIAPRQIFQHQTVAELAAVAGTLAAVEAEQGAVVGTAPLLPIQAWFFAGDRPDRHWFNQSFLLSVDRQLEPAALDLALDRLLEHHDALRLRFRPEAAGWVQDFTPPAMTEAGEAGGRLEIVDLTDVPAKKRRAALEARAAQIQASLDLEAGQLLRAALFDLGADEPRRLLLAVHHLAVDGVSWRILFDDLERAASAVAEGREPALPPKTTSVKAWAEKLAERAGASDLLAEAEFWLRAPESRLWGLPVDDPSADNLTAEAKSVAIALSAEETHALLHDAPAAYRTQIQDLLLAALHGALVAGSPGAATAGRALAIDLEGHGREEDLVPGVDLTRTVGWFTSLYPVILETPAGAGPGERIRAIKERLRAIPSRGLSYGLLRFLGPEPLRARLAALPAPAVSFNYLGQTDTALRGAASPAPSGPEPQAAAPASLFSGARENPGPTISPRSRRPHELAVSALIAGGALRIELIYGGQRLKRETVEAWAEAFRGELLALVAHCREPEAGGPTPSDFPLARLDQATIDRLFGGLPDKGRGIEDVYPLSPLQEGMVFQTLAAPGAGVYFVNVWAAIQGEFDDEAFALALARLLERHAVLRTSYLWQGAPRMLQVVHAKVEPRFEILDWRELAEAEKPSRFAALVAADRARGFALDTAPLFAARIVRWSESERRLMLSNHHSVLDGWSFQPAIGDLFTLYAAIVSGGEPDLPVRRPYRDYIAWLAERDLGAAEEFWRRTLLGFAEPTPLVVDKPVLRGKTGLASGETGISLSAEATAAVEAFARREQVTLNTLIQAATGALFARLSGRDDVVFGTAVSGRPPELAQVESMLGLFINTLPTRIETPPERPIGEWLRELQERQLEMRQYEHTPLLAVQGWSDVPPGRPLFEAILVFENFPRAKAVASGGSEVRLKVTETQFHERNNLPLTLVAAPLEQLYLGASYDAERFDDATASRLVGWLASLVEGLVTAARIGDLPLLPAAERAEVLAAGRGVARPGDAPPAGYLHARLAEQAALRPEAPAVIFEDGAGLTLSYRDLDERSNRLARHLRALGFAPELPVGLCFDRSPDLVVALFAILKAGAAFLPLDPAYPEERLAFQVADAGALAVVTDAAHLGLVRRLGAPLVVAVDDPEITPVSVENAESAEPLPVEPFVAERAAYLLYTSGSTGRPKGVVVTHRGLRNLGVEQSRLFGVVPDGRVLQFASPAFDAAVAEFAMAVEAGAALVMAPKAALLPGPGLVRLLKRMRVTKATLPPSALAALPAGAERELPDLANLVVAGEACPPALAARWA
ncbi:MAG TPA: condensation domain-containing protein, partial [Thermoanaerobaculia bacterium]|nr:condensation domain-containing protein [Thermoanaerobaculia bacterium]